MFVESIEIHNFNNSDYIKHSFNEGINEIEEKDAYTILKAIGLVIKYPNITKKITEKDINSDTFICASININSIKYIVTITYSNKEFRYHVEPKNDLYELIKQKPEEDDLLYFVASSKDKYSNQLSKYLNSDSDFLNILRRTIKKYLKENSTKTQLANKPYDIELKNQRMCLVRKIEDNNQDINISHDEEVLFKFYCFLYLNELWKHLENIHDFNHIFPPLLIVDIQKYLESEEIKKWAYELINKLDRQVILF